MVDSPSHVVEPWYRRFYTHRFFEEPRKVLTPDTAQRLITWSGNCKFVETIRERFLLSDAEPLVLLQEQLREISEETGYTEDELRQLASSDAAFRKVAEHSMPALQKAAGYLTISNILCFTACLLIFFAIVSFLIIYVAPLLPVMGVRAMVPVVWVLTPTLFFLGLCMYPRTNFGIYTTFIGLLCSYPAWRLTFHFQHILKWWDTGCCISWYDGPDTYILHVLLFIVSLACAMHHASKLLAFTTVIALQICLCMLSSHALIHALGPDPETDDKSCFTIIASSCVLIGLYILCKLETGRLTEVYSWASVEHGRVVLPIMVALFEDALFVCGTYPTFICLMIVSTTCSQSAIWCVLRNLSMCACCVTMAVLPRMQPKLHQLQQLGGTFGAVYVLINYVIYSDRAATWFVVRAEVLGAWQLLVGGCLCFGLGWLSTCYPNDFILHL